MRYLHNHSGDQTDEVNKEHDQDCWPPLLEAACDDDVEAARVLLNGGADMYAANSGGETPLLMAAQVGSPRVFQLLVERGCQIDTRDDVPWMLTQAAGGGHLAIVVWLLENGAEVDATDSQGCTALTYAAHKGETEVMEELLKRRANPNHRDNDDETVLMWAADHAGNAGALRILLRAGAEVNARSDVGEMKQFGSALHWAMGHGDTEMIRVLLDAGAEVNAPNVLIKAAYNGFSDVVGLLLERGGDTSVSEGGLTALEHAIKQGHQKVVELLRDRRRGGQRPN